MTGKELVTAINTIMESPKNVKIYFVMRDEEQKDVFSVREVQIENGNTHDKVKEMFKDFLNSRMKGDLQICSLSDAEERVDAVYRYDYEKHPKELDPFWGIPDTVKAEAFTGDEKMKQLVGYIISIATSDRKLYLYKKHYAIAVIKKDTLYGVRKMFDTFKSTPKILTGGAELFQIKDDAEMLQINGTVHMLKLENEIFVLDPRVFEQLPGVHEMIEDKAKKAIEGIKKTGLLGNVEMLESYLDNTRFARKLARIGASSPVLAMLENEKLAVADIVAFTRTPLLTGIFSYTNDGKQLVLKDPKGKNDIKVRDAFLYLLSDSYLVSELTKMHYTSIVKDKLTKNKPEKEKKEKKKAEKQENRV